MRRTLLLALLLALPLALLAGLAALSLRPELLREAVVALVARETGARLVVHGPVDVELWPRPAVSLARIELAREGVLRLAADRLDVGLAPVSLLRLAPRPERLRLVRPRVILAASPAALVRTLGAGTGPLRLELLDGRIDASLAGRSLALAGLDLELDRDGSGRLRLRLSGRIGREPLRLALTGRRRGRLLRLDLTATLGEAGALARLGFAGDVAFVPEVAVAGRLDLALAGPAAVAARLPLPEETAAWLARLPAGRVTGRLIRRAGRTELADLVLEVAGTSWRGRLVHDPETAPPLALDLRAGTLVLPTTAPADLLRALRAVPVTTALELALEGLRVDGLDLGPIRLSATLASGGLTLHRLDARPGGEGDLRLEGRLHAEGEFRFALDLALPRAGPLLDLLAPAAPWPADLRAGELLVAAACRGGGGRVNCPRLDLRSALGRFSGSLARPAGGRAVLRGRLERLDLAPFAATPAAHWARALAALSARGPLRALLEIDRLAHGRLLARGVRLEADLARGRLEVRRLTVEDLAGGRGEGRLAADLLPLAWQAEGELTLPAPARLWRMATEAPVPPWLAAPGTVTVRAEAEGGEAIRRWRATAAGEGVTLTLAEAREEAGRRRRLALTVDAPAAVLRRLGVPVPTPADLPRRLALEMVERRDGRGLRDLAATLRLDRRRYRLELARDGTGGLAGRLAGPDLPPWSILAPLWRTADIALALGLPPPEAATVAPAPPLPLRLLRTGSLRLDLALGDDLVGRMTATDGTLRLDPLALATGAGRFTGRVTLTAAGEGATLALAFDWRVREVTAEPLLAPLAALLRGRLGLGGELAGRGRTLGELRRSLEGTLEVTLEAVALRDVTVDPARGRPVMAPGLALPLPPRTLRLRVAGGRGRTVTPVPVRVGATAFTFALDLDPASGAARLVLTPAAGGPPLVLGGTS